MIDGEKIRDEAFLRAFKGSCPFCDYVLKEPTNSRCPECGSQIRIRLVAPFRFYPWHALLAAISVSAGVCLDRLLLLIYGFIKSAASNPPWLLFGNSGVILLVLSIAFVVVWKYKDCFERVSKTNRIVLYGLALLLPAVVVAVQHYILIVLIVG